MSGMARNQVGLRLGAMLPGSDDNGPGVAVLGGLGGVFQESPDPRPFKIYRNSRGWPCWYQRFVEAWWVIRRTHSLYSVFQAGMDHGTANEYRRTVINRGS